MLRRQSSDGHVRRQVSYVIVVVIVIVTVIVIATGIVTVRVIVTVVVIVIVIVIVVVVVIIAIVIVSQCLNVMSSSPLERSPRRPPCRTSKKPFHYPSIWLSFQTFNVGFQDFDTNIKCASPSLFV